MEQSNQGEVMREAKDIEADLKKEEEALSILMKTGDEVKAQAEDLQNRLRNITENASLTGNKVAALRLELQELTGSYGEQGLCFHDWQRDTLKILKNNPGVEYHYSTLIKNLIKTKKDIVNSKGEVLTEGKARARMLDFLKHLIENDKVERCKDGKYKWTVLPWAYPYQTNVVRPAQFTTGKLIDRRESIGNELVANIRRGLSLLQRDAEVIFHRECIKLGISADDDFKSNAQFIEALLYKNAQPGGILQVYEKRSRLGDEISNPFIKSSDAVILTPDYDEWGYVPSPTVRQEPVGTKRKGSA